MYSAMMYLMTLALLVVILSIQVHVYVQAGPIPIPAAGPIPIPAAGPIPIPAAAGGPNAWPVGPLDPANRDAFKRAEEDTTKYIAKRATAIDDEDFSTHVDDAAVESTSITAGDNNGESATTKSHEAGVGILPIPRPPPPTKPRCSDVCPAVWEPLCAHNKMGDKKTFGNTCLLNVWNCRHHFNAYVEDYKGECEDK
ncbi:MAG: hypothetical protein JOS17DRAFT_764584 [Linnemannia elongata]|nr:MAG: hypothetical protein JOS17DRAFT_764584 [Linnemannia elongata]